MKEMERIKDLDKQITKLRKTAEEILKEGSHIEAVKRNTKRILASTAMLEMNISDVVNLVK